MKIRIIRFPYYIIRHICDYAFRKIFPNAETIKKIDDLENHIKILEIEIENQKISRQNSLLNLESLIKDKDVLISNLENENSLSSLAKNELEEMNAYLFKERYNLFKKKRIKVGILVFFYEHWDSLDSVYRELKKDPRFEPIVFLGARNHFIDEWRFLKEGAEYLSRRRVSFIPLYDSKSSEWKDLKDYGLDLLLVNTPWEACFPEQYHAKNTSKFVKVAYIPYGIMSAKLEDTQFNMPFHNLCWRIFVESPLHKELYSKYSTVKEERVIVTGYPKLDTYLGKNLLKIEKTNWKLKKGQYRKRIIWAPHWTVGDTSEVLYSSFLELKEYFFNLAKENSDIEIMIKPHPGLWDNLIVKKLMTKNEIISMKRRFMSLPNLWFYESPGYFDYFKESDALILDSISFISEYYPTKKPIFFITKPGLHKFNKYGNIIMKGVYKGWEEREIDEFIKDIVVQDKDPLYNERIKILKQYFYLPKSGIAKGLVNHLYQELLNAKNTE